MPEMTGKVALVTGASRGIGAAVARAFRAAGANVALAARNADALDRLAGELGRDDGHALAVPTDVSDPAAVAALVERTVERFGRLDFACNNAAGGGHPPTPLADVAIEAFDSGIATSLRGVFLSLRAEIPAIVDSGGGAIVNMSSICGVVARPGIFAYHAAKGAVVLMTQNAAVTYAPDKVRVNSIAPGFITTPLTAIQDARISREFVEDTPLGHAGEPRDIAAGALYLASDEARFVTGVNLPIDGGYLAR